MTVNASPKPSATSFARYVHFTGITAWRVNGSIHLDASWHRDITHHGYMAERIVVCCPIVEAAKAPDGTEEVRDPAMAFEPLPVAKSTAGFLLRALPIRLAVRMWRMMQPGDLVFAAVVEHPVPYGWIALPLARLRGAVGYTFLESAAWRPVPGLEHSGRYRLRASIVEAMNRWCLRYARFAFVTQRAYRELLPRACPVLKSPATWFLPHERRQDDDPPSGDMSAPDGTLRLLLAARLSPAKGVSVLLEALERLDREALEGIHVTVLGAGDMLPDVESVIRQLKHVRLEIGEPVPYGPAFHATLRTFDAVVVVNLSDEQPRIIFDAYAQAVPVIASATTGNLSVVTAGETALVVPVGSVEGLAQAIRSCLPPEGRVRLRAMGEAGWRRAKNYDHLEMHRQRHRFIASWRAGALPRDPWVDESPFPG